MSERKKLLILDDEPNVARTIALIAESAGCESRFETTATAFFEAMEEWQPDIIVLDLIMPAEGGQQILVRLAEQNCQTALILTSGVGRQMIDAAARSASDSGLQVLGVLAKPFSPSALRQLLADSSAAPV